MGPTAVRRTFRLAVFLTFEMGSGRDGHRSSPVRRRVQCEPRRCPRKGASAKRRSRYRAPRNHRQKLSEAAEASLNGVAGRYNVILSCTNIILVHHIK